jgi:hypothetical protein
MLGITMAKPGPTYDIPMILITIANTDKNIFVI